MYRSDFDLLKEVRLPNWGRYSRTGMPNLGAGVASVYQLGKRDNTAGVDAEGEYTGTHDEAPRIDRRDAELIDGYIGRVHREYRVILCNAYYRLLPVSRMRLDAAVRQLLDAIDDAESACNPRIAR